jgi:hypothetical protein
LIGVVTHYFDKINVAAMQLTEGELTAGDTVHIKGHATDLTTRVDSLQIEHLKVGSAKKGEAVGFKVPVKVHEHDKVFKLLP